LITRWRTFRILLDHRLLEKLFLILRFFVISFHKLKSTFIVVCKTNKSLFVCWFCKEDIWQHDYVVDEFLFWQKLVYQTRLGFKIFQEHVWQRVILIALMWILFFWNLYFFFFNTCTLINTHFHFQFPSFVHKCLCLIAVVL